MAIKSNFNSNDPDMVSQDELEQLFMPLDQEVLAKTAVSDTILPPTVMDKQQPTYSTGYQHCHNCFKFFMTTSDLHCCSQCKTRYRRCICCRKAFIPQTANQSYCSKQCTARHSLVRLLNHHKNGYNHRYKEV